MIVAVEPHEPVLTSDEADTVLEARRFVFQSGNCCVVTPCKKNVENGMCRVNVTYAWECEPSDSELAEVRQVVEEALGMGPAVFQTGCLDRKDSERVQDEWLGKGIKPRRTIQ